MSEWHVLATGINDLSDLHHFYPNELLKGQHRREMFGWVLEEKVPDFRMKGKVCLEMWDDECRKKKRVGERVILCLACQGLCRISLHGIGKKVPVERKF
jgi:hypothetical protein